jgi:hypothetical protein
MSIKGGRHVVQRLCYPALQMVTQKQSYASAFLLNFLRGLYMFDFYDNKLFEKKCGRGNNKSLA